MSSHRARRSQTSVLWALTPMGGYLSRTDLASAHGFAHSDDGFQALRWPAAVRPAPARIGLRHAQRRVRRVHATK